jgi:opacity protein-like surface antigen
MTPSTTALAALVVGSLALPTLAQAEEWHGSATIYGWLPAISGAQNGPDGEPLVDITGPDVLAALQFAAMAAGEIRRDRLGLMFDGVYADLDFDGEAKRVDVSGDLNTEVYFASGAVAWRLYEEGGALADVYGGIRAMGVTTNFGVDIGQFSASREATVNWVDPIVGLRGAYPLGDRFSVSGRADVGGFSVGSDLTWEVYGGVNYAFAEQWAGTLGYRYMSIDYEADRLTLDIALQGPLIGLTYSF